MPDAPQVQAPSIGEAYLSQLSNGGSATDVPNTAPAPALATPPAPGPQNAQPAAPAQPAQPAVDPVTAKHNLIGRFFQSITSGGTGSSASNLWRSLIGGALVGMGAAENAPVVAHGPYGDIRDKSGAGAASRAWSAEQGNLEHQKELQQRQDQIDKQNKQREFENKLQMDDQTLRKAADARAQQASIQASVLHEKNMKLLDLNIATGNFEAAQRIAQSAQQQVNFFNALQDVGAQPLADQDGEPLQFASHAEAEEAAHKNPKFFVGDFKTRTAYNPSANKYEIYRVPDTDIKNVQLKDPTTGVMHNIPRMSATEYLDYQTRVQNLQKGKLEIQKVTEEINRLHNEVKASGLYGSALKDLTAATDKNGNVNLGAIPAGSRSVLVEHSAKGLEDALRARSAAIEKHSKAVEAADPVAIDEANQNIEEATQIVKHYSSVLTTMTGRITKAPIAQAPGSAPDTTAPGVGQFQAEQKAKVLFRCLRSVGTIFNTPAGTASSMNFGRPSGRSLPAENWSNRSIWESTRLDVLWKEFSLIFTLRLRAR